MRATKQQQAMIYLTLTNQLRAMNLQPCALTGLSDCWVLFTRFLNQPHLHDRRPLGYGNNRAWLFPDLDDNHIETVFRKYLGEHKPDVFA